MNVCDIDGCVLVHHEQQAGRAHTGIVTTNGLIFTWGRYLPLNVRAISFSGLVCLYFAHRLLLTCG